VSAITFPEIVLKFLKKLCTMKDPFAFQNPTEADTWVRK
jgi:hypothetical protein